MIKELLKSVLVHRHKHEGIYMVWASLEIPEVIQAAEIALEKHGKGVFPAKSQIRLPPLSQAVIYSHKLSIMYLSYQIPEDTNCPIQRMINLSWIFFLIIYGLCIKKKKAYN